MDRGIVVSVNKYLRNFTHTPFDGAGEMGEEGEVEEANDTEVDWGRGQYTKEINTSQANANVVTTYPWSMVATLIGPARRAG